MASAAPAAPSPVEFSAVDIVTGIITALPTGDYTTVDKFLKAMGHNNKGFSNSVGNKIFILICKQAITNREDIEKAPSDKEKKLTMNKTLDDLAHYLLTHVYYNNRVIEEDGKTLLMYACMANLKSAALQLIYNSADIIQKDSVGKTALDLCDGSMPTVENILRLRDPIAGIATSEIFRMLRHDLPVEEKLIQIGIYLERADLTGKNEKGDTILIVTCKTKQSECALKILTRVSDINLNVIDNGGNTALIWAAALGLTNVVEELIRNNARLNIYNKEGYTALTYAVSSKHWNIVLMLIEAGALVDSALIFLDQDVSLPSHIDTILKSPPSERKLLATIHLNGPKAFDASRELETIRANAANPNTELTLMPASGNKPTGTSYVGSKNAKTGSNVFGSENAEGGRRRSRGRKQAGKGRRSRKVAFMSPVAS